MKQSLSGSRSRTSSADADFFLNDDFGFLAPKMSRVPTGRAVYDKAGYPLIGKREIQAPQFKHKEYNINTKHKRRRKTRRTQSMGDRAFSKSLNTLSKTPKNKVSRSTARYKSSATLPRLKQRKSLPPKYPNTNTNTMERQRTMPMDIQSLPETKEFIDKKMSKYLAKHSDSKTTERVRNHKKRNKRSASNMMDENIPKDYYPSAFSGIYGSYTTKMALFEDTNMITHKKCRAKKKEKKKKRNGFIDKDNGHSVIHKYNKKKDSKKSKKKKQMKDKKGTKKKNNIMLFESETVSTDDDGHNTSDHESFLLKRISVESLEPIKDTDDIENDEHHDAIKLFSPQISEDDMTESLLLKRMSIEGNNDILIVEDNDDKKELITINDDKEELISVHDDDKKELITINDDKEELLSVNDDDKKELTSVNNDDTNVLRNTEKETDDISNDGEKEDNDVADDEDKTKLESNHLMISHLENNDDQDPSEFDAQKRKTEENTEILSINTEKDPLSDHNLLIRKTDETKDETESKVFESSNMVISTVNDDEKEIQHALPLQEDTTAIEKEQIIPESIKDDGLSDANLIIHKKDENSDNDAIGNDFENSNVIISAQNEDTKDTKSRLPFEEEMVKTEKAIKSIPMKNGDDLSDSHLIISKKDDKEKEREDFEGSNLVIAHRDLQNEDDVKVDPFGAENIKMSKERDLNDMDDSSFVSERYRLQQEMEQQLKAEEDKYRMRMLAIRQMRERMAQTQNDKFEEERMLLHKLRDDKSGWGFKFPFDFSAFKFGLNLNWITVQYDEVEYNEEGNIVLTVHGQKVELPSSKVLKSTDSQ